MSTRVLCSAVALAILVLFPSSAGACASDQSSYLDSFPDAECLLLGSTTGTEIDADGGLRLKTGGTATPTVWDTNTQFDNPPTGDKGSLQVVGTGTGATLELQASELPLTRTAPALSPTGAELAAGPTQVRDGEGVEDPSVIRVGQTYVMYYTGYAEDGSPPAIFRVESSNGRDWTRPAVVGSDPNPAPVLTAGPSGSFDSNGVFGADVLYDPADTVAPYRMYYSGISAQLRGIGYASSTDGVNWVKHGTTPVLPPGLPGSRDAFAVAHPSVMKDGQLYKMWYEGDDSTVKAIGYATSVDGVTFKRAGLPATLQQDPLGGGDPKIRFGIFAPTVWKTSTGFKMVFGGRNSTDPTSTRILGATSDDGIDWTMGGPEINAHAARFYATNFFAPDMLLDPADNSAPYKLYFAGDRAQEAPADDRSRIGLAEAATATGALGVYTGGSDPLEAIYNPGADSTRFDARSVRGLSVADPGTTNDWVGAYAGTRSTRTDGSGDSTPRLGIATYDPAATTPAWVKRDGSQADKSILPLGGAAEDASGQRDPALVYKPVGGPTDDWWLYYTALPSDASNPSIRLASSDEENAQNELRPDPASWAKVGLVLAGASHPSVLRTAAAPVRIYHTVEDGTPTSMALIASTSDDDLDGPFGSPTALSFTGATTCDPDGAKDPAVIQIGTTLHMLYTGIDGSTTNTCYATADMTVDYTTFARKGLVMPPSDIHYAYDERAIKPASMFVDSETVDAPLNVYFTGTDRGERRFIDAVGNTGIFDQRTRVGRATSAIPIAAGLSPSGSATGQLGTPDGPLVDFRKITRVKTGSKVEMSMSVLQPYSSPTDPSKQFWSDWTPVISSSDDTASEDLTFRFGVRAARWRARLSEPIGTPKLDKVTVESGPLQFEPAGSATTTEIKGPDGFTIGSWTNLVLSSEPYTFPGATASTVAGTVTVFGAGDATVVPATPLTLSAGSDQTIPLSSVVAKDHPALKVKFDLSSSGNPPQSTPLVKQLQVTYTSSKDATDSDGDGVFDEFDQCPTVAAPGQANGCPPPPPPDADGDGIPDAQDACPNAPAPGMPNGCPDADRDGVQDALDACPAVAAPGSPNGCPIGLSLAASKPKIVYGASATLTGTVLRGPLAVPGQLVTILGQSVGSAAPKVIGTAVTDVTGRWVLVVKPKLHTTYSVTLAGVPSPAAVTVQVAHKLTLKLRKAGRKVTFTGTLAAKHKRRTVIIQRKSGRRWVRFARLKTNSKSAFKLVKRLRKGSYQFRVTTAKDAQHLAGTSPVRKVRVR